MNLKEKIKAKKLYHYLNLDYPQDFIQLSHQTNNLINYIMNDFLIKYGDSLKDRYVIFESQGDFCSLIAYHILKHIQSIEPFQILFYGSKLRLYKREKIKDKRISKRTFNKLKNNDKIILISCYNPIYKVANIKKNFNDFEIKYDMIKAFTIEELKLAADFYGIKLNKKEKALLDKDEVQNYSNFCCGAATFVGHLLEVYTEEIKNLKIDKVKIVKMNGNQNDNEVINEIIDSNDFVFYYFKDKDCYEFLKSGFERFLKNKSNIPNTSYFNVNEFSIVKFLKPQIEFIGDFTEEEKELWKGE